MEKIFSNCNVEAATRREDIAAWRGGSMAGMRRASCRRRWRRECADGQSVRSVGRRGRHDERIAVGVAEADMTVAGQIVIDACHHADVRELRAGHAHQAGGAVQQDGAKIGGV